jgi:hypothetical protein
VFWNQVDTTGKALHSIDYLGVVSKMAAKDSQAGLWRTENLPKSGFDSLCLA